MSYAARDKYDKPGRAQAYRDRSARRNREEWRLLARALDALDPQPRTAWDVPCGTGRVAEHLIAKGIVTRCADLSPAMRAQTDARLAGKNGYGGVLELDLEVAPSGLEPADVVVCFRFLHHLPGRAPRRRVLHSLRALTKRDLLLSFHHPVSAHNARRRVKRLLGGRPSDRFTLSTAALAREARETGWRVANWYPLARYRRELWIAHLRPQ